MNEQKQNRRGAWADWWEERREDSCGNSYAERAFRDYEEDGSIQMEEELAEP